MQDQTTVKMTEKVLPVTRDSSRESDRSIIKAEMLNIRLGKLMKVGILQAGLHEGWEPSAVVRHWIRLGAAMEGVDSRFW